MKMKIKQRNIPPVSSTGSTLKSRAHTKGKLKGGLAFKIPIRIDFLGNPHHSTPSPLAEGMSQWTVEELEGAIKQNKLTHSFKSKLILEKCMGCTGISGLSTFC